MSDPDSIPRIHSFVIKHYPNKKKKRDNPADRTPDLRGSVEITWTDGLVQEFDLATWKPGPGKSQTTTMWKPKWVPDGRQDEHPDAGAPAPAPANGESAAPTQSTKPAQEVKDDAQGW